MAAVLVPSSTTVTAVGNSIEIKIFYAGNTFTCCATCPEIVTLKPTYTEVGLEFSGFKNNVSIIYGYGFVVEKQSGLVNASINSNGNLILNGLSEVYGYYIDNYGDLIYDFCEGETQNLRALNFRRSDSELKRQYDFQTNLINP